MRGAQRSRYPSSVPSFDSLELTLRRGTPLLWAHGAGSDAEATLGWGEAFRIEARGPERIAELSEAFRDLAAERDLPPSTIAFATATFAADSAMPSVLIVPEVIGRWRDDALELRPNVPGAELTIPEPGAALSERQLTFDSGDLTRTAYRAAVERAVALLDAGEADKIVLARDLRVRADEPLDVAGILTQLAAANPSAWTFRVDGMVGASPEMLIEVHQGAVHSRVLAGSAPVRGNAAMDDAAATALMSSGKDRVEHEYAARSVSARLAPIAKVRVSTPGLVRLPTIMHLATDISGSLNEPLSALDVVARVHPSAAVCGTPTERAAELIAELEGFDRGRYAGPVGWVDAAGNGEFAIALRCGQLDADGRGIRLFAGGGIVTGSRPEAELAETAQKFLPMQNALLG